MAEESSELRVIRRPEVIRITGESRSGIYAGMENGTFPPSVRLGKKSVGWVHVEIMALNAARIAGCSDNEIRALVAKMKAERSATFARWVGRHA